MLLWKPHFTPEKKTVREYEHGIYWLFYNYSSGNILISLVITWEIRIITTLINIEYAILLLLALTHV